MQIWQTNQEHAQGTESKRRACPMAVHRGGRALAVSVDQQAHLGSLGYTDRWARRTTVDVHAVGWKVAFAGIHGRYSYSDCLTCTAYHGEAAPLTNLCNRLAPSHPPQVSSGCCEMRRTASSMPSQSENILVTARARNGGSNTMPRTEQCVRNSGRLKQNGPTQRSHGCAALSCPITNGSTP